MIYCVSCGAERRGGRFCMECGAPFEESGQSPFQVSAGRPHAESSSRPVPRQYSSESHPVYSQSAIVAEPPTRYRPPNPMLEQLKGTIDEYARYFLKYVKNPSAVFRNPQEEYVNGLATFLLFAILTGISYFTLKPAGETFLPFVGETLLYFTVHAAIIIISLYTISRFFGPELTVRKFIGIYGTYLIPSLIVGVIAMLLIQMDFAAYGIVLLSLSATYYALFILPLYLIVKLLTTRSSLIDPLYAFLAYIAMAGILHAVFFQFAADRELATFIQSLAFL